MSFFKRAVAALANESDKVDYDEGGPSEASQIPEAEGSGDRTRVPEARGNPTSQRRVIRSQVRPTTIPSELTLAQH